MGYVGNRYYRSFNNSFVEIIINVLCLYNRFNLRKQTEIKKSSKN